MGATRTFVVTGIVCAIGLGTLAVGCGDDTTPIDPVDAGSDAPLIDGNVPGSDSGDDGGVVPEGGLEDAPVDTTPPDTTPPGAVGDLAATADTHASVTLTWTAPPDEADAGTVASYELRWATTPITTVAEFLAATPVTAPEPLAAGSAQSAVVTGLTAETDYHFAIRAKDAAGNLAPLSNDAAVTTKPRASFLVSEIAPVNGAAEGGDFVEIVATKAGSAADIEIRHSTTAVSALLHKLAPLDVAVGDRIVVHVVGLPGAAGFAQEDTTKDKASSTEPFATADAYDVYSEANGLIATNSLVSVMDGATFQDAVPYSNRAANASAAAMTAFADAHAAGAWTFSAAPVAGADDCATLREVVNGSSSTPPACGGDPGFLTEGSSIQRNGVVDTNTRADFFVAAQTRGAANAPFCATEGAALAITEVNPNPDLVELTVTSGGSLRGFTVRRNPRDGDNGDLLSTLPPICASAGDVIVLHLGVAAGTPSETTSKDEHPVADNPGFYDGAWDVASTSGSSALATNTSLVIAVRDPGLAYVEAAAFSSKSTAASGTYEQSLTFIQSLGLWLPETCGGAPCTGATTPTARDLAASWNGVGATATDDSCRRSSPASSPTADSWSVGPQSFGQ